MKGEGKVKKAMKESFKILNEACVCLTPCVCICIEVLIFKGILCV